VTDDADDEEDLLVNPLRRMDFISLTSPLSRPDTCELDVFAEVVSAVAAEKAALAGYAWFDGYSVSCC
jgi:hypothetical protein